MSTKNVNGYCGDAYEKKALQFALLFVGAKKYKWEDTEMEDFVKEITNNPKASYYPQGELVISKDYLKGSLKFKLSWKFTISSLLPNNDQLIFVDATNGDVINNIPLALDINTSGIAETRYSSIQTITNESYSNIYRLREVRNGVNVLTLNLNSTLIYGNATDFTNSNTNWTAGSWATFNLDQVALEAHWAVEKVLDFWRIKFNRNSIDNSGLRVLSYIHTDNQWDGAQWVGYPYNFIQIGDGSLVKPLVAIDVIAHEFGHGITQFTSSLTPGNQESGALNEGFSDIWGACVEYWADPNKQTWLSGEEVVNWPFNCIRNMQDPKSIYALEGPHPDTYNVYPWDTIGEPHYNSTVLSHWFYLISQGGSGINGLNHSYIVDGLGIETAQRIAYNTLIRLYSSADYFAARDASIQATIDTFGISSSQVETITNAWYAVGVGDPYQYTISGPSQICDQGTYKLDHLPIGATISWSATPSGIVTFQSNGDSVTITKVGNRIITLSAQILVNGNVFSSASLGNISVGQPIVLAAESTSNLSYNSGFDAYRLLTGGTYQYSGTLVVSDYYGLASNYSWSKISGSTLKPIYWLPRNNDNSMIDIYSKYLNAYLILECEANNSCGSYSQSFAFYTGTTPPFIMSPNPASSEVTITMNEDKSTEIANNTSLQVDSYEVQLWNSTRLVKKVKAEKKTVTLSLNGLPKGEYFVHILIDDMIIDRKILRVE